MAGTSVETAFVPRLLPAQGVPTRDGLELPTDVHLPGTPGRHPALLVRTPYGRRRTFLISLARQLTKAGFAVALQDFRTGAAGRGGFLENEESDGYDTLAWLARQPWADGRVGLLGLCISSFSNFLMASSPPPPGIEIRAVANVIGTVDVHSGFYQQGALRLHWGLPWAVMVDPKWAAAPGAWQQLPWDRLFRHLPVAEAAAQAGGATPIWQRLAISRPAYGDAWRRFDARRRLADLRVPVLHLSGWYDIALDQVLEVYQDLAKAGAAEQRLLVGPWDHRSIFDSFLHGRTDAAVQAPINLSPILRQWFERWLGGPGERQAADRFAAQPEVLLFVQEEKEWIGADGFPLAPAPVQEWYLTSRAGANGLGGDGALIPARPQRAGRDRFTYDPADPVPTLGGVLWPFAAQNLAPGPADQSAVERRPDVLVYTGPRLTSDLLVAGPIELELWAATSAVDTDFTAKLVDVAPDGTARLIQDGIVRGRFHRSPDREELLEPRRPYRFHIEMQATAHCFRAGHRLRLEVSSSNFPKFDRNLNTGEPLHTGAAGVAAEQTVFHGGERASRLRLPVLPRTSFEALRWTPPREWRGTLREVPDHGLRTA